MRERLGLGILRAVGVIMLLGALAVAVFPRPVFTDFDTPVVLVTLVVVLVGALAARPRWLTRFATARWLAPGLAVVGGALGAALGELMRYPYGWDAAVVMDIAHSVHSGTALPQWRYSYLSLYPNNFPLVVIDRLGIGLGSRTGLSADAVLVLANAACLAITLWLVHRLVRCRAGAVSALVATAAVLLLVGISPWMSVPYTDLYAMPFLVAVPVLAELAWTRRAWRSAALWAAAGASGAVAYLIKTTPVVVVVALVLVILVLGLPGSVRGPGPNPAGGMGDGDPGPRRGATWLRSAAAVALVLAPLFLASSLGAAAARAGSGVDLSRVDTAQSPPILWWVATGTNMNVVGGRPRWGAYNRALVNAIGNRTQPEMVAYARDYIGSRWSERGATGMLRFYANKAVWNWSDASFWAWGEGIDSRQAPLADNALVAAVTDVNGFHGRFYRLRMSVTQGVWIGLLVLGSLGLLRAPVRRDLLLLALTTLGIGAFTLVFEGRSRYLFAFVPLIVALCCSALPWLPGRHPTQPASE
ncbi:MAG: glycosyltransferase family 39 protein [Intrasporangium sp.]|uniref:glycosyltransferase family 39 protein n=1 Tax=Intrasporangium sp. TaxID=1925024 RepID=UPI003F7E0BF6